MFVEWLTQYQDAVMDIYADIRKAQGDPRCLEEIRRAVVPVLRTLLQALAHELDWKTGIQAVARNALAQNIPLQSINLSARGVFLAVKQLLEEQRSSQTAAWLIELADLMLIGGQVVASELIERLEVEIAERRRREIVLSRTQELLEQAYEQNPAGIMVMEAEGLSLQTVNAAALEILQIDPHQLHLNMPLGSIPINGQIYHADGRLCHSDELPLVRCLKGEMICNELIRVVRTDGTERWILGSGSPIYNEQGAVVAGVMVFPDVTAHKKMENALDDWQLRYDLVTEASEQAVYDQELPTGKMTWNRMAERVLGYQPEELDGSVEAWISRIHPEDVARTVRQMEMARDTLSTYDTEYRFLHKSGEYIWIHNRGRIFADADGNPMRMVGAIQDVTRHKLAELERIRLQQEVIEAQQRALKELATPIIPILDRIIVMPLIGTIDTLRARDVTRALLRGISEYQAEVVILDITGVPLVDSEVAAYFNKTLQAARLKGARPIITGISDAVAETLVDLGIDWSGLETLRDLQSGLAAALRSMGIRLQTNPVRVD